MARSQREAEFLEIHRSLVGLGHIVARMGAANQITAICGNPGAAGQPDVRLVGTTNASGWTHLIPGMIVAGVGIGLANIPLASTAVGVVRPERAGMASGVNSTFRQIGIATGIAALGSIFSHQVADGVRAQLANTPLYDHAGRLSSAVAGGQVSQAIGTTAPGLRGLVANAARTNFIDALNHITLIAAELAFAAGVLCLLLIC